MKLILFFLLLLQTLMFAQESSLEKVKLQLQWKYQFQFAGFIMAKELGYYQDVGLDVELLEYHNTDIMQDLEDYKIDYAITNSNISYKNKSLRKVTLVATYFQKSPLVLVTQKDIQSILDLKNKTIMMSKDNRTNSSLGILFDYFEIEQKNNKIVTPTFNMNDFIEKKVDAVTAFRSNEPYFLEKKNIPYNIIDPIEHGFSTNAINLFVSHQRIQTKPKEIENFLNATKKGWVYALNNIEEVAALIQKKYQPNKSVKHLVYEGEVTKKMMLLNMYEIGEVNRDFVMRSFHKLIKDKRLNKDETPDKLLLKREDLQAWIQEQYIKRTEYTFAILLSGFFLILVSIILLWSLKMRKEIKRRVKAEGALKHQAEHDSLTNLPNRTLFLDRLNQSIEQAKRLDTNVAILYIDLDHFKNINDSLGHHAGDEVLVKMAKRLSESIRDSDTVARVGGDEFIIILNNFTNFEMITSIIENIMYKLIQPLYIQKQQMYLTLSLGVSIYPHDGLDSETLIKNADAAMYTAKDKGRNNYQYYSSDMTKETLQSMKLEAELRQSIYKKQMEVYYQLQIDATNNSIIGMEALVRWNHPDKGLVSPATFIPFSEKIGFIIELDTWVMQEAIAQFNAWHKAGLRPGKLSMNLSALMLEQKSFTDDIQKMLENINIHRNSFFFEITESQLMSNLEQSIQKLNELHKLGVNFSIDDFGTGYSSLAYLKKLPISKLKIDRSFIMDIPGSKDDQEITKTIISMAKSLNIDVIAEGVETEEQKDFLLENGCNEIQGYYYHKPSSAKDVESQLRSLLT